ncbi:MAG: SMP-30/gluconolactonase/LRE family protein [Verrucomicrobiota bacterium]
MHRSLFCILFFLTGSGLLPAQNTEKKESYPEHPDSQAQEGVPKGELKGPFEWKSEIYPGTTRNYWLYLPAQYDASKPACSLILQDGLGRAKGWKIPQCIDNLIHQKAMPVTVGIFIDHGKVIPKNENAQPRFNRSFEYDSMGDRYARFLLEELLPEIGKTVNLSEDPNDRAIGGASSGAICAFTAAWERPDAFRRVLSTIGTYVGLRGGNEYPTLIRKTEPKPIRVFLQDGRGDLNLYAGDWWMSNLTMLSALKFAGYDVHHIWGEGGHNSKHAAAIMPDALKWLWRDYPEPITAGVAPVRRTEVLIEGEEWELVSDGHGYSEGPAVNAKGEVYFSDVQGSKIHKIGLDGTVSVFAEGTERANGLMFGPDGYLYACQMGGRRIVRYDDEANLEVILEDAPCNDLVVMANGTGYYTDPRNGNVWHVNAEGERRVVAEDITFPNGLHTTADQSFLHVADSRGQFTYSFMIQSDGSLAHRQTYGYLHVGDGTVDSGADGMTLDTQGRLYIGTRLGVQVFDQLGRCHLILNKPTPHRVTNVVFGGPELDVLFATCGDKVFKRKLLAKGVVPWKAPIKPPKPGL